jgi:hypothetical protein
MNYMELDSAERVFGPYIEITGWPRGMHNEESRYQYSLPNIVQLSNRGRERASCREKVENAYETFLEEA